VLYSNSNHKVEVHVFDPSLQHATGYHDTLTNLSSINYLTSTFIGGRFLGNSKDQLAFVSYKNNGSGKVEIHLFDPTLQKGAGYYDAITAISAFDPTQ
jgi:hypothetical protein